MPLTGRGGVVSLPCVSVSLPTSAQPGLLTHLMQTTHISATLSKAKRKNQNHTTCPILPGGSSAGGSQHSQQWRIALNLKEEAA